MMYPPETPLHRLPWDVQAALGQIRGVKIVVVFGVWACMEAGG